MKTEDRHIEKSAKDTTAFVVIKNLIIIMIFSAIMMKVQPVYFFDTPLWPLITPILFICYLGYRVSVNRSQEAHAELYDVTLILQEAEEAEERANAKHYEADEMLKEANAKALESERNASALQTLSDERRLLQESLQVQSKDLASARQLLSDAKQVHAEAIESMRQAHEKATTALSNSLKQALNRAEKAESELKEKDRGEREEMVRKAALASRSSNKGDMDKVKASMNERARLENEPLFLDFEKFLKKKVSQ